MPTQQKIDAVADLKALIERAALIAAADYRGLPVRYMQDVRRGLKKGGVEVRVIKNRLLRIAAQEAGQDELMRIIDGPTALAISYDDVIEAAKAIMDYAKTAPSGFAVRGAFLDGQVISEGDLKALTGLPPKPVMIAQIAGQLQSPLAGLVALLGSPIQEFSSLLHSALSELPGLIEARVKQLEATQ
jgi:large subunit ribosomal protein L10